LEDRSYNIGDGRAATSKIRSHRDLLSGPGGKARPGNVAAEALPRRATGRDYNKI
jgi:hypothetical protein